jgi:hypothetical protein
VQDTVKQAPTEAQAARARRCPLCEAPPGVPCRAKPEADHLARFVDAYVAGQLSRAYLAAVVGELVVIDRRHDPGGGVMIPADERAELARRYLAEARQRDVDQLPPTLLMRECGELRRLLGQVLAMLAERQDESRQLAQIRQLLAGFDWEFHDRQLALETIERIVTGGAA